jgi:15-cis-phytoene synthase
LIATADLAPAPETLRAYEHCRRVTLQHAKTFYFASLFLSKEKRAACYAVYAFCRYMDDLIDRNVEGNDGTIDRAMIDRTIEQWERELDAVYLGLEAKTSEESECTPVMRAWADTLQRYRISRTLPGELIEGVMMDLRSPVRYGTFDELRDYCYKVASTVGLMTSEIFGYSDPVALAHAIDLGIAMQLTNILRDIGEDAAIDRIYIPLEELERFSLDESCLIAGRVCSDFRRMMRFQIERAHSFYDSADRGIPMLEQDSRLTVTLMSHNYRRILPAIEELGFDVFSTRASIPLHRKLMSVPALWMSVR